MTPDQKQSTWRPQRTAHNRQAIPGEEFAVGRQAAPGQEIRTGKPQVKPSTPTHVRGTTEGNAPGHYKAQPGHNEDGTSTARRSTGVKPEDRDPIDPTSPNLSPA